MRDEDSAGCLTQALHIHCDPEIASLEVHIFKTFIQKNSSCCKSPSYTGKRLHSVLTHLNKPSVSSFCQLCHCINRVHNHHIHTTAFHIKEDIKVLFSPFCIQLKKTLQNLKHNTHRDFPVCVVSLEDLVPSVFPH